MAEVDTPDFGWIPLFQHLQGSSTLGSSAGIERAEVEEGVVSFYPSHLKFAEQILRNDYLLRLMDREYSKLPKELKQLISKVEGLEIETKETPSEDVLNQFSKSCASFANTQEVQ